MKPLTREEINELSQEEVERRLYNQVYEACKIIETLERLQKVFGNGHHARQKIADFAIQDLRDRWIKKDTK
jgi:L-fucose isomerase-like protein